VVAAGTDHLAELRAALGLLGVGEGKETALDAALTGAGFTLESRQVLRHCIVLTPADAAHAAAMGPSAFHLDPAGIRAAAARLPPRLPATIHAVISRYRRR
jgi:hypothetical protein